jgi:hypothetical protein
MVTEKGGFGKRTLRGTKDEGPLRGTNDGCFRFLVSL